MESVPGLNSDPWHNYRDGQDAFVATEVILKMENISDIELVHFTNGLKNAYLLSRMMKLPALLHFQGKVQWL